MARKRATSPVFHREIIIFVSIMGEKGAIGERDIALTWTKKTWSSSVGGRVGFRIGTKDRLFEFRKGEGSGAKLELY